MRLVQLSDTTGNHVWIDADRVIMIGQAASNGGTVAINVTALVVEGLGTLPVRGAPSEVAKLISFPNAAPLHRLT